MQVDARVGVRNRHLETRRRREQERERETVKALIMRHRESERTTQRVREGESIEQYWRRNGRTYRSENNDGSSSSKRVDFSIFFLQRYF